MALSGNLALLKQIKEVKKEIEYVDAGRNISLDKVDDTTFINVVDIPEFTDAMVNNKSVSSVIDEVFTNTEAIAEQTTKINKNILDIKNNSDNIAVLVEQNKKQTNFIVDGFVIGNTYKINDFSYYQIDGLDNWFISKIDNNTLTSSADFDDVNKWLKTNTPDNSVDLDGYYTKIETNNLLLPLEQRLLNSESKITKNTNDIDNLNNSIFNNYVIGVEKLEPFKLNGRNVYSNYFSAGTNFQIDFKIEKLIGVIGTFYYDSYGKRTYNLPMVDTFRGLFFNVYSDIRGYLMSDYRGSYTINDSVSGIIYYTKIGG